MKIELEFRLGCLDVWCLVFDVFLGPESVWNGFGYDYDSLIDNTFVVFMERIRTDVTGSTEDSNLVNIVCCKA
jgi:hypothetical protein